MAPGLTSRHTLAILGDGIAGRTLACCLQHFKVPFYIYDSRITEPKVPEQLKPPPESETRGVYRPLSAVPTFKTQPSRRGVFRISRSVYSPLCELLGIDEKEFVRKCAVAPFSQELYQEPLLCHRSSYLGLMEGKAQSLNLGQVWNTNVQVTGISNGHGSDALPRLHFDHKGGLMFPTSYRQHAGVIAADGCDSVVPQAILGQHRELTSLPYVAFAGRTTIPTKDFKGPVRGVFKNQGIAVTRINRAVLTFEILGEYFRDTRIRWVYSRRAEPNDPLQLQGDRRDVPVEFHDEIARLKGLAEPYRTLLDFERLASNNPTSTASSQTNQQFHTKQSKAEKVTASTRVTRWEPRTGVMSWDLLMASLPYNVCYVGDVAHTYPVLSGGGSYGVDGAVADAMELAEHISQRGFHDLSLFYNAAYPRWKTDEESAARELDYMHSEETWLARAAQTSRRLTVPFKLQEKNGSSISGTLPVHSGTSPQPQKTSEISDREALEQLESIPLRKMPFGSAGATTKFQQGANRYERLALPKPQSPKQEPYTTRRLRISPSHSATSPPPGQTPEPLQKSNPIPKRNTSGKLASAKPETASRTL